MMKRILAGSMFLALVLGGSISMATSEVVTVPYVDLNQYLGKWYEIAAIPQSFQKDCVANTTAEYSAGKKDLIEVINSCDKADGQRKVAKGRARVEDTVSNAKLKVTFVKIIDWVFLFGGNYWVIDLAPDYSYAVVGDPTRDYAWILSRTPVMNHEVLAGIESRLVEQGYDTSKVLTSIQNGGIQVRVPLNEFLKQ